MAKITKEAALLYHSQGKPGKIEVVPTKPYSTQTEVYPMHIPLGISQGCPVISDNVMRKVDALLKAEKKPVLLWVYD